MYQAFSLAEYSPVVSAPAWSLNISLSGGTAFAFVLDVTNATTCLVL
jgi:hypothetical protein